MDDLLSRLFADIRSLRRSPRKLWGFTPSVSIGRRVGEDQTETELAKRDNEADIPDWLIAWVSGSAIR